jgi:hypothetical protein
VVGLGGYVYPDRSEDAFLVGFAQVGTMSAECFCGCGQQLRFGKKRASGHGAEVRRLLAILEAFQASIADAQGTAQQRANLATLIVDGQLLDVVFQNIAHGLPAAPPPIHAVSGWFRDAERVTRPFAKALSTTRGDL